MGLTAADQLDYNRFLASAAHERGLAVGLKNDVKQIPALVADFDFAVDEERFRYRECGTVATFVQAGKPVFQSEYAARKRTKAKARAVCPRAEALGFETLLKRPGLRPDRIDCGARTAGRPGTMLGAE